MSESAREAEARLRAALAEARSTRERSAADAALAGDRMAVRVYQRARLAQTHADLLADSGTAGAARFFLDELYGTEDVSARDAEVEKVIKVLVRFLPASALSTLADALEIDALSERLDRLLALAWTKRAPKAIALDAASYRDAYREMGHHDERERQIELTEHIGLSLCKLARVPLLRGLLAMMRSPAHAGGVGHLHDFLERGYDTFTALPDARGFVAKLIARERAEHARLLAP